MSNYVDLRYEYIVSQLSQFKRKDNDIQLSLPFCGDGEKNKLKARGYVFLVGRICASVTTAALAQTSTNFYLM